jgi:hypothetical protein
MGYIFLHYKVRSTFSGHDRPRPDLLFYLILSFVGTFSIILQRRDLRPLHFSLPVHITSSFSARSSKTPVSVAVGRAGRQGFVVAWCSACPRLFLLATVLDSMETSKIIAPPWLAASPRRTTSPICRPFLPTAAHTRLGPIWWASSSISCIHHCLPVHVSNLQKQS